MSIFGTVGKVVGLDDLFREIGQTVRQVLPNKGAQRELDRQLAEMHDRYEKRIHEQILGQLEINKTEAQHASIFVAGWRPFVGWVCGVALAYHFVISRLIAIFVDSVPVLDIESLISLLVIMLGSSGYRTFEKIKGVNRDALKQPVTNTLPQNEPDVEYISEEVVQQPSYTSAPDAGDPPWNSQNRT